MTLVYFIGYSSREPTWSHAREVGGAIGMHIADVSTQLHLIPALVVNGVCLKLEAKGPRLLLDDDRSPDIRCKQIIMKLRNE